MEKAVPQLGEAGGEQGEALVPALPLEGGEGEGVPGHLPVQPEVDQGAQPHEGHPEQPAPQVAPQPPPVPGPELVQGPLRRPVLGEGHHRQEDPLHPGQGGQGPQHPRRRPPMGADAVEAGQGEQQEQRLGVQGGEEEGEGVGGQKHHAAPGGPAAELPDDQGVHRHAGGHEAGPRQQQAAQVPVGEDQVQRPDQPGVQGEEHQEQGPAPLGVSGVAMLRDAQVVIGVVLSPGGAEVLIGHPVPEDAAVEQGRSVEHGQGGQPPPGGPQGVPPGEGLPRQGHGLHEGQPPRARRLHPQQSQGDDQQPRRTGHGGAEEQEPEHQKTPLPRPYPGAGRSAQHYSRAGAGPQGERAPGKPAKNPARRAKNHLTAQTWGGIMPNCAGVSDKGTFAPKTAPRSGGKPRECPCFRS